MLHLLVPSIWRQVNNLAGAIAKKPVSNWLWWGENQHLIILRADLKWIWAWMYLDNELQWHWLDHKDEQADLHHSYSHDTNRFSHDMAYCNQDWSSIRISYRCLIYTEIKYWLGCETLSQLNNGFVQSYLGTISVFSLISVRCNNLSVYSN